MRVLIADDEAPARARLKALLAEIGPPWGLVAEAANGPDAVRLATELGVDIALLDIRMPGMDGLEAARRLADLPAPPAVIFVTAFEGHALEAFEGAAQDYLLKPIRRDRLERALNRALVPTRAQLQALEQRRDPDGEGFLRVIERGTLRRIPLSEVIYLHADQKYVTARLAECEVLLEDSLKSLEERFGERFLRIHRATLVAKDRLVAVERRADGNCVVRLAGMEQGLDVSRRHLSEVKRWVRGGKGHA